MTDKEIKEEKPKKVVKAEYTTFKVKVLSQWADLCDKHIKAFAQSGIPADMTIEKGE